MTTLHETVLARLLMQYGVGYRQTIGVHSGYRNISHLVETNVGPRNLILYKHEPGIAARIRRVNTMGRYLHSHDVPVRYAYDERIMTLTSKYQTRYAGLYNHLPGVTIAWEMYTMKHIKLLGWAMGDMHRLLTDYTQPLPSVRDEYESIFSHVQHYFARPDVQQAMKNKLRIGLDTQTIALAVQYLHAHPKAPAHALHMDLVRGNVLFRTNVAGRYSLGSTELSGILDLEKAAQGPPEFDVARSLAFLFVDSIKSPEQIVKYFVRSGYIKRGHMSSPDMAWIRQLIDMFLLYDLYKFLRDNPYESLSDNHHFVRTRDILCQRQRLQYSR